MIKYFLLSLLWGIMILTAYQLPAMAENVCLVEDPTGTQLNVRESPGGKVLHTLPNGFEVDLIDVIYDKKNKPWAKVSGHLNGKWQPIGWLYMPYLNCNDEHVEAGITPCKVLDPTGTPLNVRETPAGKIVGTLQNNEMVYFEEFGKDNQGRSWTRVFKYTPDGKNHLGWVFSSYLKCSNAFMEIGDPPCKVADPTGTPLNIRANPAGKIVGSLKNGEEVYIQEFITDKKGNKWARVEKTGNTSFQPLGWVYSKYLQCP
jgi:hypothetical protein